MTDEAYLTDGRLRTDWYTRHRLPPDWQASIVDAIPDGYRMTLTHGGRTYTARLWRDDRVVLEERHYDMEVAAARVIGVHSVTTTDAQGYVTDIEDVP